MESQSNAKQSAAAVVRRDDASAAKRATARLRVAAQVSLAGEQIANPENPALQLSVALYYNTDMYRLDTASGVPIYRQIVDQIAQDVAAGRLVVGDKLPSVRELARALPANQNTVLKAYELLERDGVIERKHGNGTFVTAQRSPLSAAVRRNLIREQLTATITKAIVLGVDPHELHTLLDEQWAALAGPRSIPAEKSDA